jgi:hypothetical protein
MNSLMIFIAHEILLKLSNLEGWDGQNIYHEWERQKGYKIFIRKTVGKETTWKN